MRLCVLCVTNPNRCSEAGQEFDESTMGAVHVCTYGGGRYDSKGCGR